MKLEGKKEMLKNSQVYQYSHSLSAKDFFASFQVTQRKPSNIWDT